MKITFFSNFLNHHQLPFCKAMLTECNGEFNFVACEPISASRLALGYEDMNRMPFVVRAYEDSAQMKHAMELCLESDVIIHASAHESFADIAIKAGKPVFRYSERILKNGVIHAFSPRARRNVHKLHTQYKNDKVYMLCASAFCAMDFYRFGAYKSKAYRWGYFPAVKEYGDIKALVDNKQRHSILWAGRLIDLKHPEYAVKIADKLKKNGFDFNVNIIGNGKMEGSLREEIVKRGLEDRVKLLGAMSPEKVREYMEKAEIFLFTSDRHEGWGAVLNEAMNSGCAVVASHIIGSVPFLLNDGENGVIYKDGNLNDLYNKVKYLLEQPVRRKEIGLKAYDTLNEQWNAENAAKRFVKLAQTVIDGNEAPDLFKDGVASKAKLLKDGWYK